MPNREKTVAQIAAEWTPEPLSEDTVRRDIRRGCETGDRDGKGRDDSDGFWSTPMHYYHADVDLPLDGPLMAAKDLADYPTLFASGFEKDVVSGKRRMSVEQVSEYVARICRDRVRLANELLDFLPGWLLDLGDEDEIAARLRCVLYQRYAFHEWSNGRMADAQDGVERDEDGKIVKRAKGRKSKQE